MKIFHISLVVLLVAALFGCGPAQVEVATQSPVKPEAVNPLQEKPTKISLSNNSGDSLPSASTLATDILETTTTPAVSIDKEALIGLAKQDLAERLNIDINQITVEQTAEITWTDVSKGCSSIPGQILTQDGQVHGYRVILEATERRYIYNTSLQGQVILCPDFTPGANIPLLSKTLIPNQTPQSPGP